MDRGGHVTSHLSGLFYRNVNLLSMSIKPIYIIDGRPPSLKKAEIERRKTVRQEAVVKYSAALKRGDLEGARKYAQATSVIKDYMVEDTKALLDLLGIPWVLAPSEGEATAAHLTRTGVATDAASQDYDSLLFGAERLVRNVTVSGRRKLPGRPVFVEIEPEELRLPEVLGRLGVSRAQLVDLGILLGTDFNPDGFKGLGPVPALKLMREYGGLEKMPSIQEELRRVDYASIRRIFLEPSVADASGVRWGRVDGEGVVQLLCGRHDFSEERVRRALEKLEGVEERRSESLDQWFR
jgi:flap endonuclease-1